MHELVRSLWIIVIVYMAFVAVIYVCQRKMIYHPYDSVLDISNLSFSNIETVIISGDKDNNLPLTSLYISAKGNKETIVWFHGNAVNHKDSLPLVFPYVTAGYGVLFVEYPGFAGNSGAPTEKGIYINSRIFINWLLNKDVPETDIILYGQSIGSGAAVQMATEYTNIKALVLESPFVSLGKTAQRHLPFLPTRFLIKDNFDNGAKIKTIKTPTLFMFGSEDQVVLPHNSKILFASSPAEDKKAVMIEGAGHNDLYKYNIGVKVIELLTTEFGLEK